MNGFCLPGSSCRKIEFMTDAREKSVMVWLSFVPRRRREEKCVTPQPNTLISGQPW